MSAWSGPPTIVSSCPPGAGTITRFTRAPTRSFSPSPIGRPWRPSSSTVLKSSTDASSLSHRNGRGIGEGTRSRQPPVPREESMSASSDLNELNHWLHERNLHGYWARTDAEVAPPQRKASVWKWADIYAGLLKAGELVPVGPTG